MSQTKQLAWCALALLACGGQKNNPNNPCVADQPCTPDLGSQNFCRVYATACDGGKRSCVPAGVVPDDQPCGNSSVCSAGNCGTTRTVSAAMTTIHVSDDGTRIVEGGWPSTVSKARVTGLVVFDPSSAGGYRTLPVDLIGSDFHFSVPSVLVGPYFIQVDVPAFAPAPPYTPVVDRIWYQAFTSKPDLSLVVSTRQRVSLITQSTPVNVNLSGLSPWQADDDVRLASSPLPLNAVLRAHRFTPQPAPGAVSLSATTDWWLLPGSVVSAAGGDSFWLYQRRTSTVGAGATAATFINSIAFTKVTGVNIADGTGGTITSTLAPAPQSGTLRANFKSSQFATLAPAINPGAVPTTDASSPPTLFIAGVPHSAVFPDQPQVDLPFRPAFFQGQNVFPALAADAFTTVFLVQPLPAGDVAYGDLPYGRVFDSTWKEAASISYSYDVPMSSGAGSTVYLGAATYSAFVPAEALPDPIVPVLGPPSAPQINGADAFTTHAGTGAQPTISWSAPKLGTATRYVVSVAARDGVFQNNDVASVSAVLLESGSSFRIPPGFMKSGAHYSCSITAVSSPAKIGDPLLRVGSPTYSMNTAFGYFTP